MTDPEESDNQLAELEDIVKDAVIQERSDDLVLLKLIELELVSINEGRPLFTGSPLNDPVFYRRYFRKWVREGLEEAQKFKNVSNNA